MRVLGRTSGCTSVQHACGRRAAATGAIRGVLFTAAGTGLLIWATGDVLRAATAPGTASFQNLLGAGAALIGWFLFGWLLLAGVAVGASAVLQTADSRDARQRIAVLVMRLTPAAGQRVAALILGFALLPGAVPSAGATEHIGGGPSKVSSLSSISFDRPAGPPAESLRRGHARAAAITRPEQTLVRHVEVRRGDSLWSIAAHHLAVQQPMAAATPAEIAAACRSWYDANRSTIGPEPDLIRPGQLLRVPDHRLHSQPREAS